MMRVISNRATKVFPKLGFCALSLFAMLSPTTGAQTTIENSKDKTKISACDTLVARYAPAANEHIGVPPLDVLTTLPHAGVNLTESVSIDSPKAWMDWGKKQQPPITIPQTLVQKIDSFDDTFIDHLPDTNYYALSSIGGTLHCYSTLYFRVGNGRAEATEPPPGVDTDTADSDECGVKRRYGSIDQTPTFFQEDYDWSPSMQANLIVASWRNNRFSEVCSIHLRYAPAFRAKTINAWGSQCSGENCSNLQKAAFAIAEEVQNGPKQASTRHKLLLSPVQRKEYLSATHNGLHENELGNNPADLEDTDNFFLLFTDNGNLYIVRIGHFTIGWRDYADWSVKFEEIKGGKVIPKAAFAVGMTKGKLLEAHVELLKN